MLQFNQVLVDAKQRNDRMDRLTNELITESIPFQ